MSELKFKTNIDCGGCVSAVTPGLNRIENIEEWSVDTSNPDKILTVKTEQNGVGEEVVDFVKKMGFEIEAV